MGTFPGGVTGNTADSESVVPGSKPGWGAMDRKSEAYILACQMLRRAEDACWDLSGDSDRCRRWRAILNAIAGDDQETIEWVLSFDHLEKYLVNRRSELAKILVELRENIPA